MVDGDVAVDDAAVQIVAVVRFAEPNRVDAVVRDILPSDGAGRGVVDAVFQGDLLRTQIAFCAALRRGDCDFASGVDGDVARVDALIVVHRILPWCEIGERRHVADCVALELQTVELRGLRQRGNVGEGVAGQPDGAAVRPLIDEGDVLDEIRIDVRQPSLGTFVIVEKSLMKLLPKPMPHSSVLFANADTSPTEAL